MATKLKYIPLGPAKYILDDPTTDDDQEISGGSGTVTWYKLTPNTETLIGTQAVTWNATATRYESVIPDNTGAWARADGDTWKGDVLIDSVTPARRHRNLIKSIRVRASGLDG